MNQDIIGFKGKNKYLCNFYHPCRVYYDAITYENSEAAFQAAKSVDLGVRLQFTGLDPYKAKALGRKIDLRPDWDAVRIRIMEEVVLAKFQQHPDLAAKLIATGDAHLEEANSHGDVWWGTVNGKGENHLGKILMRVRALLANR